MSVRNLGIAGLIGLACISFSAAAAAPAADTPPPAPPDAADARIEALIARMTPQEKAGQLSLFGPAEINTPNNPQAGWRNAQQETATCAPAASPVSSTMRASKASGACSRSR